MIRPACARASVLLLDAVPDIEVVGAAADGEQALDLVAEHHPDAILLDLRMPVLDGIGAIRRLTAEHPEVAIVVLTTYADDSSVLDALRARRAQLPYQGRRRYTEIARALHAAVGGLDGLRPPRARATLLAATEAPPKPGRPARERRRPRRPDAARGGDPGHDRPRDDQPGDRRAAVPGATTRSRPTSAGSSPRPASDEDRAAAIGYAHRHNIG